MPYRARLLSLIEETNPLTGNHLKHRICLKYVTATVGFEPAPHFSEATRQMSQKPDRKLYERGFRIPQ